MHITSLTPYSREHHITLEEGERIHINRKLYVWEGGKLKYLLAEWKPSPEDATPPEEILKKLNELEEGVRSGWVTKLDGTVFMSTADKHNRVTSELHDIWKKKNADYGNSFKDLREEYPESILIRIGDKYNRLKTLMKQKAEVKDESVEDTLKDLANYCIMELIERQENKDISEPKKPTQDDVEEFWEGK